MGARDSSKRIFSGTGKVVLIRDGEETARGEGVISAVKNGWDDSWDRRHPVGTLSKPLYKFTGYLPGIMLYDTVKSCGDGCEYRVVKIRSVEHTGVTLCVEASMEKQGEEDEDDDGDA